MYYFGTLKNDKLTEVFYSKTKPTQLTHGNIYKYLTGGYKTKSEAIQQANYTSYCKVVFFDRRKKENITNHNLCMITGII